MNNNICIQQRPKIGGNKLDVLKLALALLILCLHSDAFPVYCRPLFRMAVPLFFIMSSYFFFFKLRFISHEKERIHALVFYLKRLFFLKLFWTFVFFAPNSHQRRWSNHDFPNSLYFFFKDLIFSSTFQASWFLSATIIATAVLYWLIYKAKIADWVIVAISIIIYLFCCRVSTYMCLFPANSALDAFLDYYKLFIGNPYISFPAAFVWIIIGKIFAYHQFKIKIWQLALLSIIFLTMVYIDYFHVCQSCEILHDDCFVSLLFICPSLFLLLVKMPDINISCARLLRKMSVIIFCCHGTFLWIFKHLVSSRPMVLLFALISCLIVGVFIIHYSDRFRILRYSH